ncbi:MAG: shikimate kinase [Ruminococcus sp.]
MNHIILIGFMGCGKTSVGKRLARAMGLPFVDMDDVIRERAGMEITQIFEQYGEKYFRSLETEVLRQMSQRPERMVISAGGGLPVEPENQNLLAQMGTVVLLEAAVDTLLERLKYDDTRPMLKGGDLKTRIETLQKQRKSIYEGVCDVRIATDGKSFSQIVEEIRGIAEKIS